MLAQQKKRALWALWALAAGCGLSGQHDLSPRTDPGKGAYASEQALEVCQGKTLLDGTDGVTEALGVCVATGAAERACSADAGCGLGERCYCGRCAPSACREGRPCGGGKLCRSGVCQSPCKKSEECAAGEACNGGACGRACASSAECGYGGRCDTLSGVCRADLCEEDSTCGAGRACALLERPAQLRQPAWAPDGAVLVEVRSGGASQIFRGVFAPETRLRLDEAQALPGGDQARAPAPLVSGGSIQFLFTETAEGRIERRAPQGAAFGAGAPALAAVEPWERGRVGNPSAVEYRGKRLLFYEVGEREGLAVAELDGRGEATRRRLLLSPGDLERAGRWEQVSGVGSPDAIESEGLLLVYFTARGVEGGEARQGGEVLPAEANDSLGLLASDDGESFDAAQGPVFARRSNLRTYLGESESATRLSGGQAEVIFVASDAGGSIAGLGRAR
jgi:hypothetical protein